MSENPTNINQTKNSKKIKLDFSNSKYATGKRKSSVAKIWLKNGTGNFYVNGHKMTDYFKRPTHQMNITRALEITNVKDAFDVRCSVKGGGMSGQAGAVIHGVTKALLLHDISLKKVLKKEKFVTRDSRVVERKKYGHRKARRSFQFSKR